MLCRPAASLWFRAPIVAGLIAGGWTLETAYGGTQEATVTSSTQPRPETARLITALEAIKEKEGRDNALIHYAIAGDFFPGMPDDKLGAQIKEVLTKGWDSKASAIDDYIARCQPMLRQMRAGAELNHASPIRPLASDTPIANMMAMAMSVKLLCVEGRKLESDGQTTEAIRCYCSALRIGRDFTVPGQPNIVWLLGLSFINSAVRQAARLVDSGSVTPGELENLLKELKQVEGTMGSVLEAFVAERVCWDRKIADLNIAPEGIVASSETGQISESELRGMLEGAEAGAKPQWDLGLEYLQKPYATANTLSVTKELDTVRKKIPEKDRYLSNFLSPMDFAEEQARWMAAKSRLLQCEILVALQLYRATSGEFPKDLADLSPKYFSEVPVDPFTGQRFQYSPSLNPAQRRVRGSGPSVNPGSGTVDFDPTNGAVSEGEVRILE